MSDQSFIVGNEETSYTVATVGAMRTYEERNPGRDGVDEEGNPYHVEPRRAVCLDVRSGQTFSASSGDYWSLGENEPLTNGEGEPLLLVVPFSGYRDALTGEVV